MEDIRVLVDPQRRLRLIMKEGVIYEIGVLASANIKEAEAIWHLAGCGKTWHSVAIS